jgi:signal transduction histidine kinase
MHSTSHKQGRTRLFVRIPRLFESLGAVAILVVAIGLFWTIATIVELAAKPPGFGQRSSIEYRLLEERNGQQIAGRRLKANYEPPYQFVSRPNARAANGGRLEIQFAQIRDSQPMAIMLSVRADIRSVQLNGQSLVADTRDHALPGSFVFEPVLYRLPSSVLAVGRNRLVIDVQRNMRDPIIFPDFTIAPVSKLLPAYQIRSLATVAIPIVGMVMLLFTAMLCLIVDWPEADHGRMRFFVANLLCSFLAAATFLYTEIENISFQLYVCWIILLSFGFSLSALCYAVTEVRPTAFKLSIVLKISLPLVLLALVLSVMNFIGDSDRYLLFNSFVTSQLFSVGALFTAAFLLALAVIRQRPRQAAERTMLMIWFAANAFDRGGAGIFAVESPFAEQVYLSLHWMPILGMVAGFSMVVSLARQAGAARREVALANERLAARLVTQDAELARIYTAQKQMLQRQVMLEERQRIVRDMHDGIGGQLLGLMMQVRSVGVEKKQVEEGLQSSIADLRLIVDSMDTAEDGLAETLRSFEHRVRSQVEAAGMAFKVSHGLDDGKPGPGPRPTLQILRILQEAVTNAMRHSGASEIALDSRYGDEGMIHIAISDNGKGMPAEIKGGRGLTSMQSRAEAVGGVLDIQSGTTGTTLSLALPVPE